MVRLKELNKDFYKPGEVAKLMGVNPMTIITWDNQGKILFDRTPSNKRIITRSNLIEFLKTMDLLVLEEVVRKDVVYARVSTTKQKLSGDLERQVDSVLKLVATKNPQDLQIISEVGSGLNDKRKQLIKLLNMVMNEEINRIFISYKDRLTRFGFNYIETICNNFNTQIVVISEEVINKSVQEELAEDLCSIIHSFSSELYSIRRNKLNTIKETINNIEQSKVIDNEISTDSNN